MIIGGGGGAFGAWPHAVVGQKIYSGQWTVGEFAAVAATGSRLEGRLSYGRMTQGCRLLCRLVCPESCFWWLQLSLTSLTAIDHCISFALQPRGPLAFATTASGL